MSVNQSEIEALVELLDDEDSKVVSTAKETLLDNADEIENTLKEHVNDHELPLAAKVHLRDVLSKLNASPLSDEFRTLFQENDEIRLEEALFLVAKIEDNSLPLYPYRKRLNRMADELEEKLGSQDSRDPMDVVKTVSKYIFTDLGFSGNRDDYYSPANSYIHKVIDNRTGIPISLSSIVLLVGKRLDLPFRGVGMPAHFVLSYPINGERVFIDAFNNGSVMKKHQCAKILNEAGYGFHEKYLEPVTNREIAERFLRNLMNAYHHNQDTKNVNSIKQYLEIVTSTSSQV